MMQKRNLLLLHLTVLLWGFTPVLGKLISLQAFDLVWYRLIFSAISLYIFIRIKGIILKVKLKDIFIFLTTGLVVGVHWYFFYHAIKISNVSVSLAGFSTITFFGSILQPLILKKKFYWSDMFYGVAVCVGLIIILNFEKFYIEGIIYGILAAITGALFGVYNGKLILKNDATVITFFEFIGALFFIGICKFFEGSEFLIAISTSDIFWLLILSIFCTTIAFTLGTHIMKYFTPLTVIITNNLEPVYGIVFSVIIFGQSEYMSAGFYTGASIILASVFTYPFFSAKFKK